MQVEDKDWGVKKGKYSGYHNAMGDRDLPIEWRLIIEWQYRYCGGFHKQLWAAICAADDSNLSLLSLGFPDYISAYLHWTRTSIARQMREAGCMD